MFLRALQGSFNMSEYHYLVPLDEVGHGHLEQLKDYAFRQKLRQLIKDVNFLLFLKEQDFWMHLQTQDQLVFISQPEKGRLRIFLQSCLSVFSKKVYMPYSQDSDQELSEYLKTLPEEWINLWFELKKIIFFIFYRISKASKTQYKETLFDCWLLDNSKALDICLIYGPNNKALVKELIQNMYRCFPQEYENEYRQILQLTADRLQDICGQIEVCNYDVDEFLKSERKEERYHQPYEVLYQSSAGLMFKICDVLWNLQAVFEYFPGKCRRLLSEFALIHKRFIMIYCKLRQNLERKWKLNTLKSRLQAFVSLISQRIASFLQTSLTLIHQIIERMSPLLNDKTKLRHLKKTYLNICFFTFSSPALFYIDKDNKQLPNIYLSYTETLCSQMLLGSREQNLFNVEGTIQLFNRSHQHFTIIHRAAAFEQQLKENLTHLKILMSMENWRLKPFSEFQEEMRIKQENAREGRNKSERQSEKMRQQAKKKIDSMPTYNDEPQFDEEATADICWDVFWSESQDLPNIPGLLGGINQTTHNKMEMGEPQLLKESERGGQHNKKQIQSMDSLDISIIRHHTELQSDGESYFQSQVQTSGLTPTVSGSLSQMQNSVDN